ncbi:MAG: hypothetical protein LC135_03880 [Phycisphaerae bacterium]|nr:hypothetical protein [Phycisphaerae bacterium]MCZ2398993.1 hypothetical protein [Phycisphaerae bacterium]
MTQLVRRRLPTAGPLLASVVAVVAAGCTSQSGGISPSSASREPASAGPAMQHPTLEGIPLPAGFRLVDDRSFGVSTGPMRVGRFEFRGNVERTTVASFFKQYMPSGGWTLRKEDFDRGVYELRFESSSEECTIRLRAEGRATIIGVQVSPIPGSTMAGDVAPPLGVRNGASGRR